ncbi:hypothetical protein D3C81_1627970 [compost metagenome]
MARRVIQVQIQVQLRPSQGANPIQPLNIPTVDIFTQRQLISASHRHAQACLGIIEIGVFE